METRKLTVWNIVYYDGTACRIVGVKEGYGYDEPLFRVRPLDFDSPEYANAHDVETVAGNLSYVAENPQEYRAMQLGEHDVYAAAWRVLRLWHDTDSAASIEQYRDACRTLGNLIGRNLGSMSIYDAMFIASNVMKDTWK